MPYYFTKNINNIDMVRVRLVVRDTVVLSQDSSENIVIAKDAVVSLLGVENLIVVKNGDNILIAAKDKAQDIKKIVTKFNAIKK